MKILSLFDGISCARVALERAGIPVEAYYASEVDKYAIAISRKNWADIMQLGDVTRLRYQKDRGIGATDDFEKGMIFGGEIDLMCGGSPCQDLSIAKAGRKGLDGERSGLFWEYVRLLEQVKPKYFVLENVASMPKEAKQVITEALGVEPILIDAALVSAQRRKRLFWTNIPGVTLPEDRGIRLRDIIEKGEVPLTNYNTEKIKSNTIRTGGRGSGLKDKHNWDTIRVGQIGKGGQGDRIYSIDGKSVNLSANGGGRGAKTGLYEVDETIRKLTPIECERLQSLPDNYTEGISNTQRYKALGNAFNVDVVAHILSFIPNQ